LAEHLNIPEKIINKKPSADLWENQTDEGEIGLSYKILDEILFQMVDLRERAAELVKNGYSQKDIKKIRDLIVRSQYKRTTPTVPKLNNRTIGLDFSYLRDWNK